MAHSKSENALKSVSLSDCHASQRFGRERNAQRFAIFFSVRKSIHSERERESERPHAIIRDFVRQ